MSIMWHDYIMGTPNECRSVGVAQGQCRGIPVSNHVVACRPVVTSQSNNGTVESGSLQRQMGDAHHCDLDLYCFDRVDYTIVLGEWIRLLNENARTHT